MLLKYFFLYPFIVLLAFTSCQKATLVGSNDYKVLGSSARGLLSTTPYKLLHIEINYMPGYALDTATAGNLVRFLNTFINKSAGIQLVQIEIPASGKTVVTLADVVALEKKHRTTFTGNDVIAVHVLITDADFHENIFGKAYWNTSIVLFGKTLNSISGGPGQVTKTKLFSTIAQHEFGHLLGLVGQGSAMQVPHKDAANGAHCNNKNCLMFHSIETTAPAGLPGSIPSLDANCINDLKANGGK